MSLRSPLGQVLGLGSAKDGTAHWWAQRVSAVALVPLGIWFVIALLSLPRFDYVTVRTWIAAPFNGLLMILFVLATAYHSSLGVSVVIEDYVSSHATRLIASVLLRFVYVLAAGGGVFAVLKIVFGI
jgi:succinate dehydrogenase / fumarate reductase, membrane anchor subunit